MTETPVASVGGHLGRVEREKFCELITSELYYNPSKMLWDLQRTILSYARENDSLTGSSYLEELLDAFDEDGDGVIDYYKTGKRGHWTNFLRLSANRLHLRAVEKYGFLHGPFLSRSVALKYGNARWNSLGHDFLREYQLASAFAVAFRMWQAETEGKDLFFPAMAYGMFKWPSLQMASYVSTCSAIYGVEFPSKRADLSSLYGLAFQYADKTLHGGRYAGSLGPQSYLEAASQYIGGAFQGATPLDFLLYVPAGYNKPWGIAMPNVEETEEPDKIFTARFRDGQEIW